MERKFKVIKGFYFGENEETGTTYSVGEIVKDKVIQEWLEIAELDSGLSGEFIFDYFQQIAPETEILKALIPAIECDFNIEDYSVEFDYNGCDRCYLQETSITKEQSNYLMEMIINENN